MRLQMPGDDPVIRAFAEAQGARSLSPAIRHLIHMWVNEFGAVSVMDLVLSGVSMSRMRGDADALGGVGATASAGLAPQAAWPQGQLQGPAHAQPPTQRPVEQDLDQPGQDLGDVEDGFDDSGYQSSSTEAETGYPGQRRDDAQGDPEDLQEYEQEDLEPVQRAQPAAPAPRSRHARPARPAGRPAPAPATFGIPGMDDEPGEDYLDEAPDDDGDENQAGPETSAADRANSLFRS